MENEQLYVVLDVEATCTDCDEFPRDEMEVIEIGAVVCSGDGTIHDTFQAFIRPTIHPKLTRFCKELTTIKQKQVDGAKLFPGVIEAFENWLKWNNAEDAIMASWGAFDWNILRRDANRFRIPFPLKSHINMKLEHQKKRNTKKGCGVQKALRVHNLTFEGTHHRGLDDAKNISKLLPYCLGLKLVRRVKDVK